MEITPTNQTATKETPSNSVHQSDSGILSATGNSLLTDDEDQANQGTSSTSDTDNRSSCSSPDCKYLCPICETMLTSQHDFTLHIRSHNNDSSEVQDPDKGYICRICSKVLSSSASLDRHVLIHSGERPFTCKYCGDTFTTNGNMHRHMRTHSTKSDNYESDGSTDSGASADSKSVEFNNNKINSYKQTDRKRKMSGFDEDAESAKISRSELDSDVTEKYICPVCERNDFASIEMLELHLGDNHPDYPAKCRQCNQIFKNNKMLCEHRNLTHCGEENGKTPKNSVVGFKDLTFVDFSSQKFPYIARYECEKNLHKVSGSLRFQCSKCSRAFPCSSSLEIHQTDCSSTGLDLSIVGKNNSPVTPENDIRRADFFARLDLQNNCKYEKPEVNDAVLPKIPNRAHPLLLQEATKDLADIQSIISMTNNNGTLLQQLQGKQNEISAPPKLDIDTTKNDNEEETQDLFAAEFRKMKLRGEFPCRLCTAIFPNLRALKGHNRAHLNGSNNGTYRCNMCPHSSLDKAALIRHMRTHNGDRPYECALCNYAFTTKANCERHLRNRHSKTTREEVKKSIIYHPSEDPSNEEISKMLTRDDLNSTHPTLGNSNIDSNEEKTPKHFQLVPDMVKLMREKKIPNNVCREAPLARSNLEEKFNIKIPTPEAFSQPSPIASNTHEVTPPRNPFPTEASFPYFPHLFNFTPNAADTSTPRKVTPQAIHVKRIDDLKDTNGDSVKPEYPNDDSMDVVLDLSKKKSEEEPPPVEKYEENAPQDLTTKTASALQPNVNEILAQQLLKNAPKIDPTSIYASQLAFWNRNGFAGLSTLPSLPAWPFSFNPLLFQTIPNQLLSQDPQEIKERIRNLQLCGGGMVIDNVAERLKNFQQQSNPPTFSTFKINDSAKPVMPLHENHYKNHQISTEDVKPLSLNIESAFSENLIKMHSPVQVPKPDVMSSPNSVKMVIKNGVLMPKQKQRRYRTERPFSCEYCSARFTLRSNMERHIKQQHPQYWSQRQRSAIGGPGRKSHAAATSPRSGYCNLTVPSYESPKVKSYDEIKDTSIPDKIKYAILSQHLKAAKTNATETTKEEDEDYPLVIDEVDETSRITEDQEHKLNDSNEICEDLSTPKVSDDSPTDLSVAANATKIIQASLMSRSEDAQDLVPVSRLLDNASQQPFKEYFRRDGDCRDAGLSEEDEEGLVASSSTSDGNNSGTDENRSESEATSNTLPAKKKSAYSLAPNRVSCPYCQRKFPWTSSLRRHVLTHTGQKPFKCSHCPLLFTTKSNCDRHLLRKHGNSATALANELSSSNSNYMMRNVPERPFKCSHCPSSTFSTYSNLKKHISCKHSPQGGHSDDAHSQVSTGYEAGSSEDEKVPHDNKSDWDKQVHGGKTTSMHISETSPPHLQNSDLPFKCHLCDSSFSERQEALDHLKDNHHSEYDLLMSKNALDSSAVTPEESTGHDDNDDGEIRGKFPDYANRKVICAFCMRRFWSAEDLRRHMRTHTGERPFSCDICHRRFTLKHSMLRHRKKHNLTFESDNVNSDEDGVASAPAPSKFVKAKAMMEKTDESDGTEGSDLISNLLGIRDRSIIEQVLTASADDAAKLLGVKNRAQE